MRVTSKIEHAKFDRWLANTLRNSRKSADEVVRDQFKQVIKGVFKLTPPMDDSTFAAGFRAGKNAIKRETKKAFFTVNPARKNDIKYLARLRVSRHQLDAQSLQELVRWYQQQVDGRKHFKGLQKRKIWKDQLPQIQDAIFKRIGITAAGWCKAADVLGVKYEDWIGRHKSKNAGVILAYIRPGKIYFSARNPSHHPDSSFLQSRLEQAFKNQANAMRRRIISAIAAGKADRKNVNWK
jgi:hypothetical protein